MFKFLLLGSVAGVAVIAGSLYAGTARAQETEGPRFVFRYSPTVLIAEAGSLPPPLVNDPEEPGSGDDPENPGEGDPGDGEPTLPSNPGDEDNFEDWPEQPDDPDYDEEAEQPPESLPSDMSFEIPTLGLDDRNGNGIADVGERLTLTYRIANEGIVRAQGIAFESEIQIGNAIYGRSCIKPSLSPGYSHLCVSTLTLTGSMLRALAYGDTVSGSAALSRFWGKNLPLDFEKKEASVSPFDVYAPVEPTEITLSEMASVHLDSNSNGVADAGEVLRVSFRVRNEGMVPAQGLGLAVSLGGGVATGSCEIASLNPGGTTVCQINFPLSQAQLDALGEPRAVVSVGATAVLVALDGDSFSEGAYSHVLPAVSVQLWGPTLTAVLRVTYSGGWAFECRTGWSEQFVADNLDMLTTQFTNRFGVTPAGVAAGGGARKPGATSLGLRNTWLNFSTLYVSSGAVSWNSMVTNREDPRGKQWNERVDGKPCLETRFTVVSLGDFGIDPLPVQESIEIIQRMM